MDRLRYSGANRHVIAWLLLCVLFSCAACSDQASPADDDSIEKDPAERDDAFDAGVRDASVPKRDASASDASRRDASLDAATRKPDASSDAGDASSLALGDASLDASERVPALTPIETHGQPLPGAARRWTYTEFPDATCRDGSRAGVAVNLSPGSKKLMIYLEGGGSCTDPQSCESNPAQTSVFVTGLALGVVATGGVFDRNNSQNPVRDWNFVYVPYCTGDTHGGGNPDGNVPGVGPQKFVGYLNMRRFLERIVPTFRDATDVLLTGASAGGFGTSQNAIQVQRAFFDLKIKTINDSGPAMSTAVLPECLQVRSRTLWNTDATFLAECGDACPNRNDYSRDYGRFLARTLGDRPTGLIESAEDSVIRAFFGMGKGECTGTLDLQNPGVSGADFRAELLSSRELLKDFPNFSTFYPDSDGHTWIASNGFYTISAGGVRLVDWFAKIVNGQSPGHAGP